MSIRMILRGIGRSRNLQRGAGKRHGVVRLYDHGRPLGERAFVHGVEQGKKTELAPIPAPSATVLHECP